MSHRYKLVQSWSAQDGIEREADLRDVEEDAFPNVIGREIQPRGITDTGPTPENGRDGWSFPIDICSFLKATRLMRLRVAPPSIRT
jgi:hypothetical protein